MKVAYVAPLTGTLAHLSTFSSKPPNTLFLPLTSHATFHAAVNLEHNV
jgi:hypothetical protein